MYYKVLKNGGVLLFRRVKRKVRIQRLSRLARKILNTPYDRDTIVKERFNEVNRVLGENKLSKNEVLTLINKGLEPVMHIHKNCFLILNFEKHAFGVVNFRTKKIIVPCDFYDIEFDTNNIKDDSIELKLLNASNEIITYSINESATLKRSSTTSYALSLDNISKRFSFAESIEFKNFNKNVSDSNGTESKNSTTVDIVREIV